MWNDLLTAMQPTLIALLSVILTGLGGIITQAVAKHFGAKTAMIVSTAYEMASDQAAGWLKTYLDSKAGAAGETAATALTEDSPAVSAAVDYMKASFPGAIADVEKAGGNKMGDGELAADILGAFGKLLPGPVGVVAGAVSTAIKKKK